MSNIAAYAEKLMLDFALNGVTATRPTAWGIGLSYGTPSSVSGSEVTGDAGYARQTIQFDAASSPAGICSNSISASWGPFSNSSVIRGIQVWDTVLSSNSGNMLWYGTLTTPRTVLPGDSLILASGALSIALS